MNSSYSNYQNGYFYPSGGCNSYNTSNQTGNVSYSNSVYAQSTPLANKTNSINWSTDYWNNYSNNYSYYYNTTAYPNFNANTSNYDNSNATVFSTPSTNSTSSSSACNLSINTSLDTLDNSNSFYNSYTSSLSTNSKQSIEETNLIQNFTEDNSSIILNNETDLNTATKSNLTSNSRNKSSATSSSRRHQHLSDDAVEIMNNWFQEHINNPYPQLVEKENLARLGGITVKQVTAWFSNRRNRSQNTKPKRMKRVLQNEINNLFNELQCDQFDKEKLIQKFNTFDYLGK